MQDFFAHETATIDDGCRIGAGTKIRIIVISCPDVCLEKDAISVRMW